LFVLDFFFEKLFVLDYKLFLIDMVIDVFFFIKKSLVYTDSEEINACTNLPCYIELYKYIFNSDD